MPHRQHIDIQVHTGAKPNAVYGLLREGVSWPKWTLIDSFELERAGERESDRRFTYLHLSGLPVRDYRADVDLEPKVDGTGIRWRVSFTPKVPGTGWLWRWAIGRFIAQSARGLAAYAHTANAR